MLQSIVPNSFPMPAVIPSANAPQNVTRMVARSIWAPPALAPTAPRTAGKPSDAADVSGTSMVEGDTTTISNGMAAPTENVTADVRAACIGRAVVRLRNPQLVASMGAESVFLHKLPRNLPGKIDFDAALNVDFGKLGEFTLGIPPERLRFRSLAPAFAEESHAAPPVLRLREWALFHDELPERSLQCPVSRAQSGPSGRIWMKTRRRVENCVAFPDRELLQEALIGTARWRSATA